MKPSAISIEDGILRSIRGNRDRGSASGSHDGTLYSTVEVDLGRVANNLEKIPFELSLSPVRSTTTNSAIGSLYLASKTCTSTVDYGTICAIVSA